MKNFIILIAFLFGLSTHGKNHSHITGIDLFSNKETKIETSKKNTVVFFSSSSCPCSDSHMVHFKELMKEFSDTQFVAINVNEASKVEVNQKYYQLKGQGLKVLWDKDFKLADQFSAIKTPHAYLLDKTGRVVYHGGVSNSSNFRKASKFPLKDALTDMKEGRLPKRTFARALGCYIPR